MELDLKAILRILSKLSFVPLPEIQADTDIIQDLEIDSIRLVEFFYEIEKQFSIKFNIANLKKEDINTPEKILIFLEKNRKQ